MKKSLEKNKIALGAGLGVIFGAVIDNVGLGIVLGAGIGYTQQKKTKTSS